MAMAVAENSIRISTIVYFLILLCLKLDFIRYYYFQFLSFSLHQSTEML